MAQEMSMKDELLLKHKDYIANIKAWNFCEASYEGGDRFVNLVIKQHTRESSDNFEKRKSDSIYVNFPKEIVDIFSFYLTEKPVLRRLGSLDKNNLWSIFKDDCDLEGTNFDVYMNTQGVLAAVYGSVGVLVDKPMGRKDTDIKTRQDEIQNKLYPYCANYTLPNIFDWDHVRDPATGRRVLVFLKLREDNDDITRWYPDHWERWRFPETEDGKELDPIKIASGVNRLGEIPFVWIPNLKHLSKKDIGLSDITEISKVAASIMRNFSHGEEVIEWAAFPMLLEPWEPDDSDTPGGGGKYSEAGPSAVKEFDPDNPQAKPEWLASEVLEPIQAVKDWIDKKIDLIFQMAHLEGVHAVEKSKEARSAVALRLEFNQLWSVLSKKAENLNEAELKIIWYWLKWQNETDLYDQIEISRSKDFSVDDLSQSLYNIKESMKMVVSRTFNKLSQKKIVKMVLPDTAPNDMEIIHNEIELNSEDIEIFQDLGKQDARQAGLGKPEIEGPAEPPDISQEIKNQ